MKDTLPSRGCGHYNYFGITGNSSALGSLRFRIRHIWRFWLNRPSRGKVMPWERFYAIEKYLKLPLPRAAHSICSANL